MRSVSVRQVAYALAVAEQGGVSAAAAALHVSQPALSVAIAGLEEHLGKPLFIRRKGEPVVLTSFGRGFVAEAAQVLAAFDRLVDPDAPVGGQPVVIGCFEDLAPMVLGPILARLGRTCPGPAPTTRVYGFERLAEAVLGGEVDFAVTYDLGLDGRFACAAIARLMPHALVGGSHRLAARGEVGLADLAAEPLVLADQGLSVRHILDLFKQRGLAPEIAHRAATLETMRSLVANGLGVGVSYTLPRSPVSYDGRLVHVLKIKDDLPPEPVVLATNRLNPPSRTAGEMMTTIAAMRLF